MSYMDGDALNLNDDEDMMSENDAQGEDDAQGDSVTSPATTRGNKRRHSICWKNFSIVGDRMPDGTHNVKCIHCHHPYNLNLNRNGANTMLRHSLRCSKTPGSTPGANKKLDMMVFPEMMALAIVEHNLPYQFVEYKGVIPKMKRKKMKVMVSVLKKEEQLEEQQEEEALGRESRSVSPQAEAFMTLQFVTRRKIGFPTPPTFAVWNKALDLKLGWLLLSTIDSLWVMWL